MGSIEFTILMFLSLYAIIALAAWFDDDAIHEADKADAHHMHKPAH